MNEKLQQLIDLCLQIQHAGRGEDGYPYINLDIVNRGVNVTIHINDNGFIRGSGFDATYYLNLDGTPSRQYTECRNHLIELIEKHNIKPITDKRCQNGTTCDADSCIHHGGNGRCGYDGLYISDAESGEAKCMLAEFEDKQTEEPAVATKSN